MSHFHLFSSVVYFVLAVPETLSACNLTKIFSKTKYNFYNKSSLSYSLLQKIYSSESPFNFIDVQPFHKTGLAPAILWNGCTIHIPPYIPCIYHINLVNSCNYHVISRHSDFINFYRLVKPYFNVIFSFNWCHLHWDLIMFSLNYFILLPNG